MKIKVRIVMMSHLSDVQEGGNMPIAWKSNRIDFVKYLMLKYTNTDVEIDADEEYKLFIEKYPNKAFNG